MKFQIPLYQCECGNTMMPSQYSTILSAHIYHYQSDCWTSNAQLQEVMFPLFPA